MGLIVDFPFIPLVVGTVVVLCLYLGIPPLYTALLTTAVVVALLMACARGGRRENET